MKSLSLVFVTTAALGLTGFAGGCCCCIPFDANAIQDGLEDASIAPGEAVDTDMAPTPGMSPLPTSDGSTSDAPMSDTPTSDAASPGPVIDAPSTTTAADAPAEPGPRTSAPPSEPANP